LTTEQGRQVIKAFVVEDNPVDADLLRVALQQEETWPVEMIVVEDGERAISRLLDASQGKPDLIILDLNLPRRDGTEVLRIIRGTPALQHLPVAILSSSPEDVVQEKLTAAGVLADGHFTKSPRLHEFLLLGSIVRQWYEKQTSARKSSNH
jgi:CheY-like chemotaxis protein